MTGQEVAALVNTFETGLTPATYHSDYSRLSASGMKVLLKSPQEFHARYIAQTLKDEPTPSMILGSVVDCILTGEREDFDRRFYMALDGRTKEGKAQREARAGDGSLPITKAMMDKAEVMCLAISNSPLARELLSKAELQRVIEWEEDGIPMKAMLDLCIYRPDMATDLVLDIKTTDDPTPEAFGRGGPFGPIRKFLYDLQLANYVVAHKQSTGRDANAGLIALGSGDVPAVYFYDLGKYLEVGHYWRKKAIELYKRCQETGVWEREDQQRVVELCPSPFDMPEEMC